MNRLEEIMTVICPSFELTMWLGNLPVDNDKANYESTESIGIRMSPSSFVTFTP